MDFIGTTRKGKDTHTHTHTHTHTYTHKTRTNTQKHHTVFVDIKVHNLIAIHYSEADMNKMTTIIM